jgi:molybdopterin synthase catalytic subunit
MQVDELNNRILVQEQDFDLNQEYQWLCENNRQEGAIVHFVGRVREQNQGQHVTGLYLEHYPAMTLKSLQKICAQARVRWQLGKVAVIHRVGQIALSEQIVFVGVTSLHRNSAFAAAEFIMDYLKTQAPFWKKEHTDVLE